MEEKFKELDKAKDNVRYLLEHSDARVDMYGLTYWAGVVERLRDEIKEML